MKENRNWKTSDGIFKVSVNDGYCEWEYVIDVGKSQSINNVIEKIGGKVISKKYVEDAHCPENPLK